MGRKKIKIEKADRKRGRKEMKEAKLKIQKKMKMKEVQRDDGRKEDER